MTKTNTLSAAAAKAAKPIEIVRAPAPANPLHKYSVGQRVSFAQASFGASFIVTRQMPPAGKVISYRIKSDVENYERVATESQIVPLALD